MQTIAEVLFYAIIVWVFYMMTFRTKQFMELNEHMKGNVKDTMSDAGKAASVGMKVLNKFLKK